MQSFKNFEGYLNNNQIKRPRFFETADTFLQFIFELNIICYIEQRNGEKFIRWCFKDRNYSNLQPKVKTNCEYQIHYGLLKSLNFGLDFTVKKDNRNKYHDN